ncbi:MAG: sensor histidine kinase [Sphingobacteriaceae bacterium]
MQLPVIAMVTLFMVFAFTYLYYLSRFKNRTSLSIWLGGLLGNVVCVLVFFFNSGIQGPVLFTSALTLILIICFAPVKQYRLWGILNLSLISILFTLEYFHPELVPYTYVRRADKFIDIWSSYLVLVIPVFYSITYIRRSYDLERKSAEEKTLAIELQNKQILIQNQELETLNKEKNKLLSIIAHDLRSPLGNIQSYLELLTELDLDEKDKQSIEKDLLKHTKDASEMLTKLLAWSKSQMNGINVKLANICLQNKLVMTLETERAIAQKKGVLLSYDLDPEIIVRADMDMLELVVRNLINNAIKFTTSGGVIDVSANILVDECHLKIADNGVGISLERQKDIFTFSAGSTIGTDEEKGSGLGLLLCKDFIEMQGGRIWFQSQSGEGTVFHISLPLAIVYEPMKDLVDQ